MFKIQETRSLRFVKIPTLNLEMCVQTVCSALNLKRNVEVHEKLARMESLKNGVCVLRICGKIQGLENVWMQKIGD